MCRTLLLGGPQCSGEDEVSQVLRNIICAKCRREDDARRTRQNAELNTTVYSDVERTEN